LFLHEDKKVFAKRFEYAVRDYFKTMFALIENSTLFFENSSEKFFVKLHWQKRHVFNKFLKIM